MIIIPDYLLNRWCSKLQWYYSDENQNIYVHEDSEEYIISHKGGFVNRIIVKRHNENLLLGISDVEYNETVKASNIQSTESKYKKTNSFKRMGNKGNSLIRQRR